MTREELIATVSKITELRAEVSRLSGLQKELKRLEAVVDEITGTPAAPSERGRDSIEERVGRFLESHPESDWSAEEISSQLSTKIPTTRAAFSKLRKANRIIDTKRGRVRSTKTAEQPAPNSQQEENVSRAA